MKKYILTIMLFILIIILFSVPETCQAFEDGSLNFSYEYNAGDVYYIHRGSLEAELLLNEAYVSIFARLSGARYRIDETGSYFLGKVNNGGAIDGLDLGFRYYPIGQKSMERLFIGGAFGFYEKDRHECRSDNYQDEVNLSRDTHLSGDTYRLDAEVGYRFNIGSTNFSLTPSVHYGYYWKSHTPDATYKGASLSFAIFF